MRNDTCLIITIDTESDNLWEQKGITLENIHQIPELQKLFDRYNVKPTYLVSYPVASNKECVSILRKIYEAGSCEIGSHLHAWTTPPLSEKTWQTSPYLFEFPLEIQRELLSNLTEIIRTNFGIQPFSYRAGRFGFDEKSITLLEELNYSVDTSVVPLVSFKKHKGDKKIGASFIKAPIFPYYLSKNDVCQSGDSKILEVPVSVAFNRKINHSIQDWYLNAEDNNLFLRLINRLNILQIIWLYPTFFSLKELLSLCRYLLKIGVPVLNMMFHSSEILANASPYHRSKEDITGFLNKIEGVIRFLIEEKGITSKTLSEFAKQSHNIQVKKIV